ncbi:MAG TPA: PspC domain-containing protein, partial [Actinomycetes bacterium]
MTDQTQTFATPPGPPPGGRGPAPTLYRSRSDRKLAGVCGGLAAYLGIDP